MLTPPFELLGRSCTPQVSSLLAILDSILIYSSSCARPVRCGCDLVSHKAMRDCVLRERRRRSLPARLATNERGGSRVGFNASRRPPDCAHSSILSLWRLGTHWLCKSMVVMMFASEKSILAQCGGGGSGVRSTGTSCTSILVLCD